jgi:hypothetical protein
MTEPQFRLIDPRGFATRLTNCLDRMEGDVGVSDFRLKTLRKNTLLYRVENRVPQTKGKYLLVQSPSPIVQEASLITGVYDLEQEERIGYLSVETGIFDAAETEPGSYETMKLRIKSPLTLSDGRIIPACSIKILAEAQELQPIGIERIDHVRKYHLFWGRADLESVLPTGWFLSEAVNRSLAHQPGYAAALS